MNQTELDKTLAHLVRKNVSIWDKNSNTYSNKQLKGQLWENIAAKLNTEPGTCMLRWKALREKYIRQKTKFQQEGEKWELLDDMAFLDKVIQYRRKVSEEYNFQNQPQSESSQMSFFPKQKKETILGHSSSFPSRPSSCYEEGSLNDSSNDLVINIKSEEINEEIQNSIPDSSSRKRSGSFISSGLAERRIKEESRGLDKDPEELFGNLVAAMLRKKAEKDKNLYMIKIMTVLSK